MKERPTNDERPRSVVVEYYADDRPQGEQEEELERRNPGNGATRVVFQRPYLVILLEAAYAWWKSIAVSQSRRCWIPSNGNLGRHREEGKYVLLTQPGLEKEQHHAPRTTNHAAAPPSGAPASSNFVTSPGLSPGIGPLASSECRSVSPLRSDSGCAAFSGSVFRSCMGVVLSALFALAMVRTSRMIAAAVTIGGISTYQGIVIELRPKESDLKLKRKWKKWRPVSGNPGNINKPAGMQ